MRQSLRQVAFDLASKSANDRRSESRTRTEAIPARLTDLYRERVPVSILNVSRSGLGLKVEEHFTVNLPVLIECEGLLIICNVRHCVKASAGGYLLGLKIEKVVDTGHRKKGPPSSEDGLSGPFEPS